MSLYVSNILQVEIPMHFQRIPVERTDRSEKSQKIRCNFSFSMKNDPSQVPTMGEALLDHISIHPHEKIEGEQSIPLGSSRGRILYVFFEFRYCVVRLFKQTTKKKCIKTNVKRKKKFFFNLHNYYFNHCWLQYHATQHTPSPHKVLPRKTTILAVFFETLELHLGH